MINQRKQSSGMPSVDGTNEGNRGTERNLEIGGLFDYCKAIPESREWQAYQVQRVLSIKELKKRNLKLGKQTAEGVMTKASSQKANKHLHLDPIIGVLEIKKTIEPMEYPHKRSVIPAILKKVTKRTFHSQPKDTSNVTWKEPLADTKFLPVGWMKVPVVPELHQKQARSCEKFAEGKEKRKSGTAGKQLSINFTERSGKNKKPHKRNNGKTNLSKPITSGEHHDNSTQVNKIGRRNNAEANRMNSENSTKYSNILSAATSTKSPQKETTFQIEASPTTGESLFKQTFKDVSSSSAFKANGAVAFVGVKHDHAVSDNNNNSVFAESTAMISSNEINHIEAKASGWNIQESNSDVQRKWLRTAKTHGADDITAYSIHRKDLNGNIIMTAPTQIFTKTIDTKNSTITWDKTMKDVFQKSAQVGKEDNLNEIARKNEEMKPIDYYKDEFIQKNKLIYSPSQNTMNTPEKENLAQGVYVSPNQESYLRMPHYEIQRKKSRSLNALETLLKHFKPPKLPDIEVCNVLPGTTEWQKYWDEFNQKIGEYYSRVDKYARQMDDLLVDDDGYEYKKQLTKRHQEERALQISMGMTLPKPPLVRHPLKNTIEIGGYVIRPLGGVVEQANVSTCDHCSFRLEIPCDKVESGLDGVNIDTKFNIMTIAIPSGHKVSPFIKLVQIAAPTYKKVENLEIGHPLYNGGKIVITGK